MQFGIEVNTIDYIICLACKKQCYLCNSLMSCELEVLNLVYHNLSNKFRMNYLALIEWLHFHLLVKVSLMTLAHLENIYLLCIIYYVNIMFTK